MLVIWRPPLLVRLQNPSPWYEGGLSLQDARHSALRQSQHSSRDVRPDKLLLRIPPAKSRRNDSVSKSTLRFQPVFSDAYVDNEWNRQFCGVFHLIAYQGLESIELFGRRFKHELVMHLEQHLCRQAALTKQAIDLYHRNLDKVRR